MILVATISGVLRWRGTQGRRVPGSLIAAIAAVLIAFAVLHVLRGTGAVMKPPPPDPSALRAWLGV